jgi:uncharacterized YigZ family protein
MYRVTGTFSAEYEVKGSRFLARCMPTEGEKDAKRIAEECRNEFPDVSHVVYAFRCGKRGDIFGFSDDGEPKQTAGRPVFEVLKGGELTDTLILVLRWFGGTKLGTGGLVKAYTRAARLVIEQSATEELIERRPFSLSLPYRHYERGRELLTARGAQIEREEFTEAVALSGLLPAAEVQAAGELLQDLTAGEAEFIVDEAAGPETH